jgi:hypothetical protein
MSDLISGIKTVTPTYPVKPVQPANKDRKSGQRKTDRPVPDRSMRDDDDDSKQKIDEYA